MVLILAAHAPIRRAGLVTGLLVLILPRERHTLWRHPQSLTTAGKLAGWALLLLLLLEVGVATGHQLLGWLCLVRRRKSLRVM